MQYTRLNVYEENSLLARVWMRIILKNFYYSDRATVMGNSMDCESMFGSVYPTALSFVFIC